MISINNLREYILQNSSFATKSTIDIVISSLVEELNKYHFDLNHISVISGETSINFIKDDIVIRLTYIRYNGYDTLGNYVSHSDAILQPEFEKKIDINSVNYPTILVLKKLDVGNVTEKERDNIYIKLRRDGYLFNDAYKLENFGKDEKGRIYLIDYGELIYIGDEEKLNDEDLANQVRYRKYIERELNYHIKVCSDLDRKYRMTRAKEKSILSLIKEKLVKEKEQTIFTDEKVKSNNRL